MHRRIRAGLAPLVLLVLPLLAYVAAGAPGTPAAQKPAASPKPAAGRAVKPKGPARA